MYSMLTYQYTLQKEIRDSRYQTEEDIQPPAIICYANHLRFEKSLRAFSKCKMLTS